MWCKHGLHCNTSEAYGTAVTYDASVRQCTWIPQCCCFQERLLLSNLHSRLPRAPQVAKASTDLSPNHLCQMWGLNQMNAYMKCGAASAAAMPQEQAQRTMGLLQLTNRVRSPLKTSIKVFGALQNCNRDCSEQPFRRQQQRLHKKDFRML